MKDKLLSARIVLIPLNSGLHLDRYLRNKGYKLEGLNPFEFRASFGPSADQSWKATAFCLNPFEFRASFGPEIVEF